MTICAWINFWALYSVPLVYVSIVMPVPYGLYYVKVCSFYSQFLKFLLWTHNKFCQMVSLYLLSWSYFYWFADVEPFLHPRDKYKLIMVNDPLMCCWIQFASILLKNFTLIFIRDVDLIIFFPCGVLFWHWYQVNAGLINKFCSGPSSSVFWKSLRRIGVNSSLNVL